MTVREYRINLGWDRSDLARETGLTRTSVINAEEGKLITPQTAKAIADAFSRAYGEEIKVTDIKGLNVR